MRPEIIRTMNYGQILQTLGVVGALAVFWWGIATEAAKVRSQIDGLTRQAEIQGDLIQDIFRNYVRADVREEKDQQMLMRHQELLRRLERIERKIGE